jgi:hypothetical protein
MIEDWVTKGCRMQIVAIISGSDGHSRFEVREVLPIKVVEGEVRLSKSVACSSLLIHEFDAHFVNDWHNPPYPQYVVVLEGELQIQLEDSSVKNFKSGEIFLAADTMGRGHRTVAVRAGRCLVVNLEESCA